MGIYKNEDLRVHFEQRSLKNAVARRKNFPRVARVGRDAKRARAAGLDRLSADAKW